MASLDGLDAHARPPESMRVLFKKLQKSTLQEIEVDHSILSPWTDLESACDGIRLIKYLEADVLQRVFCNFLEHAKEGPPLLGPITNAALYEIEALPGLFILPALLPPPVQFELLNRLLHRDLSNPLHQTNLHLHHLLTYGTELSTSYLNGDRASHCSGSEVSEVSFFAMKPSTRFAAKDPAVHRDITLKEALDRKLRWMTLGGQYDWTAKRYPAEDPPPFPADIGHLLRQLIPDMDPQAAILNLYSPGDTLSVHRDVSEGCDQPLVSISIGCDGVFIIGNKDGSSVVTLRLQSGDAVFMTGSSRFAWHAVPKVLRDTCPTWLQAWPAGVSGWPNYEGWRGWMANKRINLNVRQMTAASHE